MSTSRIKIFFLGNLNKNEIVLPVAIFYDGSKAKAKLKGFLVPGVLIRKQMLSKNLFTPYTRVIR